ncbi:MULTISPECIES: Pr6Pr family membrane protein [Streptomyces]|uniref:Pr6Pr family membrane protein n=1 Tax=Streptomyces eurythermus TaxID=42237 RepID=A0ABW6Z3W2_9ACTN|nr:MULTISPECIES: Pr6Pr family membrane protein [Streptomyces]QIS72381.1 Pr6Pr family membrane protein [Streptomyces sp. DSM 40868]
MTAPIPRDIPDLPAVPGPPVLLPAPVPATAVVAPARRPTAAVFRLLISVTAAGGVALELLLGSPGRMLSHFSVQATALLAVITFLSATRAWRARRPLPSAVTGAALLYVVISALVYHLLLAHTTPPFSMTGATTAPERWHAQWTALQILHVLVPAAAVLDWLLLTPAPRLRLRQTAAWLLYPLAYLAFTFIRAALLPPSDPSRHLYPFLDVTSHGYRGTLANALLLGLGIYALSVLLVALDHTRPSPTRHRL